MIVIEAASRLLPTEEPDASEVLTGVLRRHGVDVRHRHPVDRRRGAVRPGAVDSGDTLEVDALLLAVGRRASSMVWASTPQGSRSTNGIVVDDTLATSTPGVWAVGDVTGKAPSPMPPTRWAASRSPTRWAAGRAAGFAQNQSLSVVFTDPEVARIGPTEATLGDHRHRVDAADDPVDRAVAAGATEGFVKLIATPRPVLGNLGGGRLVGATVVAPRAGEMVSELALAVRTGMFVGRLAQTVHPYPTWSVALRQAAAQFFMDVDGRRAL